MAEVTQQIILEYIAKTDKLQAELEKTHETQQKLTGEATGTGKVIEELKSKFGALATVAGGVIVAAKLKQFISQCTELAASVTEIKDRFNTLNKPGTLDKLRKAVQGTLSDIQLMKLAVKAENFKIPIETIGKLFEFAKLKADQTGQSTEQLAELLITSIGRNSTRGLYQLGVQQEVVNEAVKRTGSLYAGVTEIINSELASAGTQIDSIEDKQERYNAQLENFKLRVGELFLPIKENLLEFKTGLLESLGIFKKAQSETIEGQVKALKATNDEFVAAKKLSDEYINLTQQTHLTSEQKVRLSQLTFELKGLFGDSVTQINKETGALEINTKALIQQIQARAAIQSSAAQEILAERNSLTAKQAKADAELQTLKEQIVVQEGLNSSTNRTKQTTIEIDDAQSDLNKKMQLASGVASGYGQMIAKLDKQLSDMGINLQDLVVPGLETTNDKTDKTAKTFGDINHQTEQFVQTIKNGSPALNAWADAYIALLQTNPDNVIETRENIDKLAEALVKLHQVTTDVDAGIQDIGKSTKDTGKDTEEAKTATDEWILSLQTISELSALISDFNRSKTEEELAALEDRNAQGRMSDEEYARQRKAILQKQAEEDKKNALFKATLAVPVAILSAIPEGPFAIAAASILALAQLAKIAATDIPQFAKGVIDLQGPGTATSDSIPAKLSRGESVMTAEETKLYKPVLAAMRNNSFEDYIMRLYLPKVIAKNGGSQASFDDFNIVKATHENTQTLNKNFSRLLNKFDSNNSIRRNY